MEAFTTQDAAQAIARARDYEGGLRQRTEGLTQMVWGLVTGASFVTYGFASELGAADAVYAVLWLPWVLCGMALTAALWRSAALAHPQPMLGKPSRGVLRMVLVSAAIGVAFAVLQPEGPTFALGIMGALYVAMGATNVIRASQTGRFLWAGAGGAMLAAAVVLRLAEAPIEVAGTASILVPIAALFATGLWQTMKA